MLDALVKNPSRLFWVLHLGGWLAWGLVAKYAYTVIVLDEVPPRYFAYVMLITAVGAVLSLGLRYLYRLAWNRPLWVRIAVFLGGTGAAGFAWLEVRGFFYSRWFESAADMEAWYEKMGDAAEIYWKMSYMESITIAWIVMVAWSALYFGIKYYQVFQEVQKSALRSAAMAHEAQLKMLRYQLNPHFLFNTLNAVSTLILERETEDANRMVTRLSSFLRHSLDNDPMKMVTLAQEMAALQLYLDIEKVRFEERLNLELDIESLKPLPKVFYSYSGSLTTPPCSEGVRWFVIAEPEELAAELDATAMTLDHLEEALPRADILISSTASPTPVIKADDVKAALRKRRHRPMFMVDIAVPRDIEPAVARLRDVYLYSIDDLQQVVDENMQQRSEAARAAQSDVDEAVSGFMRWLYGMRAARTLKRIREQSHEYSKYLTARALNRLRAGQDPEQVVEQMASTLTNKILHLPSKHLREAAEEQDYEVLKAADRIFRRDDE